jgi:3-deoxy-D-manno-octulosonic-acid transferase
VHVTGNMKYDLTPSPSGDSQPAALRRFLGYTDADVVVIGGSLHAGEDDALLGALARIESDGTPVALVLVPRYPGDIETTRRHVLEAGRTPVLKSALDAGAAAPGRRGVLIVDTVGELGRLYAVADIAFVGGSLFYRGANKGGHNVMEPAILGVPVLFGPHNVSFKEPVAALVAAGGGMLVRDAAELGDALARLVRDRHRRVEMGARARRVVLDGQGATARNYALLGELLGGRGARLQAPATNRTMHQAPRDHRV